MHFKMYEDLEEKSVLASCLLLLPDQHPKKPKAQVEMKPIGCGRRIDNPEKKYKPQKNETNNHANKSFPNIFSKDVQR